MDALVAQLAIAQTRDRIVLVKALLRFGRRFDVPGDQILRDAAGDLVSKDRLAAPRLALDEQRALEGDRGIDRNLQIGCHYVGVGAREALHARSVLARGNSRLAR